MRPPSNREEKERAELWVPSRREQAWDWRLTRLMRYVVGPGVMIWELAVDGGHDLFVFIVGAMLATSKDVYDIVRDLLRQARAEDMSLGDLQEMLERRRGDRRDK